MIKENITNKDMFDVVWYAKERLADKKNPPSEDTRLAYKRFLIEVEKKDWEYVFIPSLVEQRIKVIEKVICYGEYVKQGKPFRLMNWQKFVLYQLYGWIRKGTESSKYPTLRFRGGYIEAPERNRKKNFIATIVITDCLLDTYVNPKVYCVATTLVKSSVFLQEVKNLIHSSPYMREVFTTKKYKIDFKLENRVGVHRVSTWQRKNDRWNRTFSMRM